MDLNLILKALSNEKRLQIMQLLKEPKKNFTSTHCGVCDDGVCVGLIEEKVGLSQSTVSEYLMVLQQAGLIITSRKGQWTYCKRNEETMKKLKKVMGEL